MIKNKFLLIVIGVLILSIFTGSIVYGESSPSQGAVSEGIEEALKYLKSMKNADGGFSGKPGEKSSLALTSWVVMALSAAGEDCTKSVEFLINTPESIKSTNDYARLLLALTAGGAGSSARAQELAEKIKNFQQDDGWFGQPEAGEEGMINTHIWSVLALASTNEPIPQKEKAREWLLARQNENGGFGWLEGLESDVDDTGTAVQALILLGEDPETSPAIKKALEYLKGNQWEDGGFSAGEWMGRESNTSSDAWVVQALIAAGENPSGSNWSVNGNNAITHMLSLQVQDGSFNWKKDIHSTPVTTTAYVVMALAGKPFPVNLSYAPQKDESDTEKVFKDLSKSHWAYQSIQGLVNEGVLGGYPDGTFRPDNLVTRAEFVKFLVGGLAMEEKDSTSSLAFSDVSDKHWARGYILTAVEAGFVMGSPDGTFAPGKGVTGAELAAILVRALPASRSSEFQEGEKWYSGYVKLAAEEGLLYPNFQWDRGASRAQCAFSLSRLKALLATYEEHKGQ
jgi:prenyltransferase beta subunit